MKSTFVAILLLSLTLAVLSKKPEDPSKGVIDVTSANEASVFAKEVDALVEFYAPWCGHCKSLAPEYAKLGAAFDAAKPANVVIAKVDCTKEQSICSRYGVKGYPTLKFFPKGKTDPEDYSGGRTADDLIKFINDKARTRLFIAKEPTFVPELDQQDFTRVAMAEGQVALVMFYAPWCGHCKTLKPTFEKLGKVFDAESKVNIVKVDATKSQELAQKYDVKGYPTLKWVTADNKVEDAQVGRDLTSLVKYVNDKAGTSRTESGLLSATAGLFEPLTGVVKKFLAANNEDRNKLIAEAEGLLKTIPASMNARLTGYYVRAMKKVLAKGDDFVSKEKTRLGNLLKSTSVSQKSMDSFQTRLNILSQF